eukprot:5156137-Pleurochrysis_carterae.AAC.6
MPALEIRDGAVDALLLLYKSCVSSRLGGYLTSNGEVNLGRVEALLTGLGELEEQIFSERSFASKQQERRRAAEAEAAGRRRAMEESMAGERGVYCGQAAAQREEREGGVGHGGAGLGRAGRVLAAKGVAAPPEPIRPGVRAVSGRPGGAAESGGRGHAAGGGDGGAGDVGASDAGGAREGGGNHGDDCSGQGSGGDLAGVVDNSAEVCAHC